MRHAVILSATILLLSGAPALAQTAAVVNEVLDNLFGDHAKFETAFEALQTAVADGDAERVAALVAYPLIVEVGERREIASAEQFVAAYDEIMTEEITMVIAEQAYEALFVKDQGIMFGNGEIWMTGVCTDDACEDFEVEIITIQSTDG